jgi:hypothetical protein
MIHKASTKRQQVRQARPALSLLEVIIALAIFLMSLTVIGQLVSMGSERALDIEQQGEAAMLAQAKMAEVIWGVIPLSSQGDQSFDEAPDYKWSMTAEQNSNVSNLWNVTVTITRERSDGTKIQSVLSQMVLDPSVRGSSQDTVSVSGTPSSGQGGSSSSGSPSSGSMQQSGAAAGAGAPKATTPSAGASKAAAPSGGAPKATTPSGGAPKATTPSTGAPKATTPKTGTPKATATTPSASKGGR